VWTRGCWQGRRPLSSAGKWGLEGGKAAAGPKRRLLASGILRMAVLQQGFGCGWVGRAAEVAEEHSEDCRIGKEGSLGSVGCGCTLGLGHPMNQL
jgi:hypothetical protein